MDAGLAWTVVGSVAGVVAIPAGVMVGVLQLRQSRRDSQARRAAAGGGLATDHGREADRPDASSEHPAGPAVAGEVPRQPPGWQPRPELLAAMEDAAPGSRIVVRALTGMRGVGKTQLAAAVARTRIGQSWRLVAWINAETEAGLLAGLAETADALGMPADDAPAAGRAVRHWLETGGDRCLIVFDNATDADLIAAWLPAAGQAQVIITSNHHAMTDLGEPVDVAVFTKAEGLAFLHARTQLDDASGAQAVGTELGWLPLALAQAAAVIITQHLDYPTYLNRLRRLPLADLLTRAPGSYYSHRLDAAILLSLDAATTAENTGACAGIMNLLAVLSPAGTSRILIHAAARTGALRPEPAAPLAAEAADRALGQVADASLITFTLDGATISAHRLINRVTRERLAATEAPAGVCQAAAALLLDQAQDLEDTWHQDRVATRDLTRQITALHQVTAALDGDDRLIREMVGLRNWAVFLLNELGDSAGQAILMGETLIAEGERVLGPDHPQTVLTRSNLARAYHAAGCTAEAATLHEAVLADRERTLGPDHPDTLISRNNLALAYQDAGRTAEAITLHERTLADRERVLGPRHPESLTSRNNLALAYQAADRTAEAITLLERTLAGRERIVGPDHPHTLTSRDNLANAYRAAGRTTDVSDQGRQPPQP